MDETFSYYPPFDFAVGETLLIDKPYDWSSFDVVKKIRNAIKIKKVGHAGTLDPLATGLLIVCTGKKTKSIEQIQAKTKVYEGSFMLGKTTPSFDLETEIKQVVESVEHISKENLIEATKKLTGEIEQVPPVFSAVKVKGRRAYKYARKNQEVKIEPKKIHIHQFKITDFNLPEIHFEIVCSKGTYIRSIARDLGKLLGVGAYLSSLRRTAIGEYKLADAYNLSDLINHINSLKK